MTVSLRLLLGVLVTSLFWSSRLNSPAQSSTVAPQDRTNPKYWALVHPGDQLAVSRIAQANSFALASQRAGSLGYEPVQNGEMVFFFPVFNWSQDTFSAMRGLIDIGLSEGFEKPFESDRITPLQQAHLSAFLKGYAANHVKGDLGELIKKSASQTYSLQRMVDVQFVGGGQTFTVPISLPSLANLFQCDPSPTKGPLRSSRRTEPVRKETMGLGTRAFAVYINVDTAVSALDRVIDRARSLLAEKRQKALADLQRSIAGAFRESLQGGEDDGFFAGETREFRAMPASARDGLLRMAKENPQWFKTKDGAEAADWLSKASLRIPNGGMRLTVSYLLGDERGRSTGMAVGWDLIDIANRGF